jgi:hypothetical protein
MGLVNHDVSQPRILTSWHSDLEDVAIEAWEFPECGGRSERGHRVIACGKARCV